MLTKSSVNVSISKRIFLLLAFIKSIFPLILEAIHIFLQAIASINATESPSLLDGKIKKSHDFIIDITSFLNPNR